MNKQTIELSAYTAGKVGSHGADDLLGYIDSRPNTCQVQLQALARHLYPYIPAQEKVMTEHSRLACVTLCGYLFDNHQEETELGFPFASCPTIDAIYRIVSNVEDDFDHSSRNLVWALMTRKFLADSTRAGFSQLTQLSERRLSLVMQAVADGLHAIVRPAPERMH